MTDKSTTSEAALAEALAEARQAPVDEGAKARAIQAALVEFDRVQQEKLPSPQGFWRRWRLTGTFTTLGHTTMAIFQRKWLYSGVAAASVAVLTVLVAQQLQHTVVTPELQEADEVEQFKVAQPARQGKDNPAPETLREEIVVTAGRTAPEAALADSLLAAPAPVAESEVRRAHKAAKVERLAMAAPQTLPAADRVAPPGYQAQGRDDFQQIEDNPVQRVSEQPVSTFSIDVDTSSYSFVRRQLNQGVLPQKAAVRVEEMINYFDYDYPLPTDRDQPFSTHVYVGDSPWAAGNKLLHIGIKGYQLAPAQKPKTNLVFLLDVSGSMDAPDKLPLVKQSMELLLSQLAPEDTVAIAVYAGAAGTVLEPTAVKDKQKILSALQQLRAGGSTAGAQGIKLAYELAAANFEKGAVNRVMLATDGDFNVGITNRDELKGFVEREREKGIYLSVLGFGQGNYQDQLMQALAQNGNGVAAYIDTLSEAQKVLVTEATRNLFPIAQDVKIQVEFNPAQVQEYRLIGYETRALAREDFNNDKVDAGDIGAGHTVTAIYEFTPLGARPLIDDSRYNPQAPSTDNASEYAFVKLRYKLPGEQTSKLISQPVPARNSADAPAPLPEWLARDTQFATAVAGFAQLLRGGQYTGSWTYDDALALAQANKGPDPYGYRTEFVQLVRKAKMAKGL